MALHRQGLLDGAGENRLIVTAVVLQEITVRIQDKPAPLLGMNGIKPDRIDVGKKFDCLPLNIGFCCPVMKIQRANSQQNTHYRYDNDQFRQRKASFLPAV